jgi:sulfite exporter TauE/SafE
MIGYLCVGLLLGLAQVAHCVGMCGVFALQAGSRGRPLRGLLAYGAGKTFTYVFIGAALGYAGGTLISVIAEVRVLLGALTMLAMVVAALRVYGVLAPIAAGGSNLARFIAPVARAAKGLGPFALGAVTGALPCGVVGLAGLEAASTGRPEGGVAVMVGLGLGTWPVLCVVGLAGPAVGSRLRGRLPRIIGGTLILLAAALTFLRVLPSFIDPTTGPSTCCH